MVMIPGEIIGAIGDGDIGVAVVRATSRRMRIISVSEAEDILLAEAVNGVIGRVEDLTPWRPLIKSMEPHRWYSVTQREIDDGSHMCHNDYGCEPGSWCSEGSGRAWVKTLFLSNSSVYERDEALADELDSHG